MKILVEIFRIMSFVGRANLRSLNILVLFLIFTSECLLAQNSSQGFLFDDGRYQQTKRISPALKFAPVSKKSMSLRQFCPRPLNQGSSGSCVGWATGYYGLTMTWAIEKQITNPALVNQLARSPLFIFNQITDHTKNCEDGVYFEDSFEVMRTAGACSIFDFNPTDCKVLPNNDHKKEALNFRIGDYCRLFDVTTSGENKVAIVLNTLASRKPVIVGLKIPLSFKNVPSSGYWNPSTNEPLIRSKTGSAVGHAVCVIGYDNVRRRFELVNSWGPSWGKDGFFTMSYDDFGRYCKYAYQMIVPSKTEHDGTPVLTGRFYVRKVFPDITNTQLAFSDLPVVFDGNYYHLASQKIETGDYFRVVASGMRANSYIYVLSVKPDNSVEILFPVSFSLGRKVVRDLAIIPSSGASIQIPIDDDELIQSDQVGEDYICILYSTEEIQDITSVANRISAQTSGILDRLRNIFSDRLVEDRQVKYQTNLMSFACSSDKGNIVPMILKISVEE